MQIATLTFPFSLHPGDIPKFRGAIVNAVGLGHTLFHGHDNSEQGKTKYSNQYPLIRYTVQKGQAQIIGMGAGADAIIRYLLSALPSDLLLGERYCPTSGYQLKMEDWVPELQPEEYTFGLFRYIALNKKNYQAWKTLEGKDPARHELLGACVTGHLRALAETAAPELDRQQIAARILSVDKVKRIKWHNTPLVGFDLVACANFIPPFGLGLGRCHSFGFGEVCSRERYYRLTNKKTTRQQALTGLMTTSN
jgi:hypothetical protein